jgi:hypothetical protein
MMRFGHPLELVSDRGTHFLNDVIVDLTTKYLIKHRITMTRKKRKRRCRFC